MSVHMTVHGAFQGEYKMPLPTIRGQGVGVEAQEFRGQKGQNKPGFISSFSLLSQGQKVFKQEMDSTQVLCRNQRLAPVRWKEETGVHRPALSSRL